MIRNAFARIKKWWASQDKPENGGPRGPSSHSYNTARVQSEMARHVGSAGPTGS